MDNKPPKSQEAENNQQEPVESITRDIPPETPTEPETPEPVVTPQPAVNESTATAPAAPRRWGLALLALLGLLLSLLALAGGLYLYDQFNKQNLRLTEQLAQQDKAMQQALAGPQSQLATLSQQQRQTAAELAQLESLPEQHRELSERLTSLAKRNPNHWQAAEANYLVTMAGRKLWLEQDSLTAAGLLEAADQRIAAMKDPSLLPLRKALAKDIAAVKAIKQADIAGTAFTLDEIINNLDTLPLNRADAQAGLIPQEQNNELSDSVSDWQANLYKTWQALLDDFIVIRTRTTDTAPLLTPEQQWYLVENIRSKLLQAQLALYRGDEVNYRSSLKMAHNWLYQYYDLSSPEVESTLEVLKVMETLKLSPVTLNRFASSSLLKQLTEQGELQSAEGESL
ncbi:uroporphyrinogen-III C-methyltransferase [Shewanella submarina]|uniref:Uroporphyrinogen-III C-methyltransferase n=1 Tax=Shewanella submarina TaxID=2016376 RepID=A0ABV7GLD2_9GAMM|nr:uroporphyrinogen-III C-methyltransferase [Shewanella submarina]MCL1035541.1 uroporphyrinogen-III C-methyltransferase [Shewanella submarina]